MTLTIGWWVLPFLVTIWSSAWCFQHRVMLDNKELNPAFVAWFLLAFAVSSFAWAVFFGILLLVRS